jgi:hypothetical protein
MISTMEIVDQVFLKTKDKHKLIKFEYYIQITLFWAIISCALTLIGLYISALLMLPWGIIQLISAIKNTAQITNDNIHRKLYQIYWSGVVLVTVLFIICATTNEVSFAIIAMLLSFILGCFHTYIIRHIYINYKQSYL